MHSIRRVIPAGAALTSVAFLAAGCGGSSPSTTSTSGGSSGSGGPPAGFISNAYKYSACMRNHGVAGFPDPKVTQSNGGTQVAISVTPGIGSSPQFRNAQAACRSILPAPSKADLAAQAKDQENRKQYLLAFAHCLRSRGVSGFPDPTAQGQLTLQMVQAAGVDLTAPQVRTAALACVSVTHGAITRAAVLQATSGNPIPPAGSSTSAAATPSP
jgi:hypothetical protein